MIPSLNEVEHCARKAVRGAGYAWGIAEEAGCAVRWLHMAGVDAVRLLAEFLREGDLPGTGPVSLCGVWRAEEGALDPLLTGASLGDCLHAAAEISTAEIARPLLAMGFVGVAAEIEGWGFEVEWPGGRAICRRGGLDGDLPIARLGRAEWMRFRAADVGDSGGGFSRALAETDAESWAVLQSFAGRIYVESTDVSRLAGAGAGVRDND